MASSLERMHTAEHILSAIMKMHYGAPRNLEFHLQEKKTKCDYRPEKRLQPEDISEIETMVNREIAKDYPVTFEVIARGDAGQYDLWKVPSEYDRIRIVKIGDFDAQPCGGNHVEHTAEIGSFRISSYDARPDGQVRIRFKLEDPQAHR